jgi:hypothetical protein
MMFQMSHMVGLAGVLGLGMCTASQFASVLECIKGSALGWRSAVICMNVCV